MAEVEQFSPARIADRLQIQHVIYRWCRAVDRLDREGMMAVFHPGAHDSHGPYVGPFEGLVDWAMKRHENIPFCSHMVGNMLIDFVSEDVALVETYVRTNGRYPPAAKSRLAEFTGGSAGPEDVVMDVYTSSRYLDRFERRNGEWRIAERILIQDWKRMDPVLEEALTPQPGWVIGRRDGQDASDVARAKLGLSRNS